MTEFQKQVKDLVEQGKTQAEICRILDRPSSSVASVVKRLGLKPRLNYENSVDHEYFDVIDTHAKAYFLGFFIADGNVSGNKKTDTYHANARFSFSIQEEDGYILEQLKEELHASTPIVRFEYNKGAVHRKPQIRFRWTSAHMQESLKELYGLTERKGDLVDWDFPFEKMPEEFLGSFIRGFIDGDGSFEQHDYVFTPSIVGPNPKWLEHVASIVDKYTGLTHVTYEKQGKTCKWYHLRWKADNSNKFEKITKLYKFLYSHCENCLMRKKQKIENYLEYRAKQLGVTSPVSVTHRD